MADNSMAINADDFQAPKPACLRNRIVPWTVHRISAMCKWPRSSFYFMQDMIRYMLHSSGGASILRECQLEARIVATYHVIEKGLTLPEIRLGYGDKQVRALLTLLREYKARGFDVNRVSIQAAYGALSTYVAYHDRARYDLGNLREAILRTAPNAGRDVGGTVHCTRSAILQSAHGSFEQFVAGRHSIRNFSDETVSQSEINSAVNIARKTPSACNRQCWRVYWVSSAENKKSLLKLLSGCRGFGQSAHSFLVLTADLQVFSGITERNQAFIDGGMFAMSLLYALHYLGVGACCLNWITSTQTDRTAHSMLDIPKSQVILMVIAVGHLQEEFSVAYSARRSLPELLSMR